MYIFKPHSTNSTKYPSILQQFGRFAKTNGFFFNLQKHIYCRPNKSEQKLCAQIYVERMLYEKIASQVWRGHGIMNILFSKHGYKFLDDSIIEVGLFSSNGIDTKKTVKFHAVGLDFTGTKFITDKLSLIDVDRVIRVNGKLFNRRILKRELDKIDYWNETVLRDFVVTTPCDKLIEMIKNQKLSPIFNKN